MGFEVINLDTDESHGVFDTLSEARGCVKFDRLRGYSIWQGEYELIQGKSVFNGVRRLECCNDFDPENIYGLASIRQSIEEDRRR